MISLNDVLLAMSNIPVDDPIAEIWEQGLQSGYKIIEYTGSLPITINADGEALLDYKIYGNAVQDSTPTPENPILPIGCGERTENLFDETYESHTGVSVIYKPIYVGNGAFTLSSDVPRFAGAGQLFLLSGNVTSGATTGINDVHNNLTRSVNSDNGYVTIGYRQYNDTTPDVANYSVMLNLGSTALPYEPYGYKLPMTVSDGNTVQTVPVYLGEVETTRRIKKLVLTGEENWKFLNPGLAYLDTITDYSKVEGNISKCSHFLTNDSVKTATDAGKGITFYNAAMAYYRMYLKDTTMFTTIDGLKSYLAQQYTAGTPVTVWYVLATPKTAVVNEPIRKIGDYTDTVSKEQAGVQIPTVAGTTVIDYNGDPKPSQMYIKYKGKG